MSRTHLSCLLAPLLLAGCHNNAPDAASLDVGATIALTSPAFPNGGPIPATFAGGEKAKAPPLTWPGAPPGVKSFALICDDPDAPSGTFTHWVIWNIPAEARALPERFSTSSSLPDGSLQGRNDFGGVGYAGPDPPPSGVHHYHFRLYALDAAPDLPAGSATKQDLEKAMKGHVVGHGELVGTYQKK